MEQWLPKGRETEPPDGAFERFLTAAIATIITIMFSWRLLDTMESDEKKEEGSEARRHKLSYSTPSSLSSFVSSASFYKDDSGTSFSDRRQVSEVSPDRPSQQQEFLVHRINILSNPSYISQTISSATGHELACKNTTNRVPVDLPLCGDQASNSRNVHTIDTAPPGAQFDGVRTQHGHVFTTNRSDTHSQSNEGENWDENKNDSHFINSSFTQNNDNSIEHGDSDITDSSLDDVEVIGIIQGSTDPLLNVSSDSNANSKDEYRHIIDNENYRPFHVPKQSANNCDDDNFYNEQHGDDDFEDDDVQPRELDSEELMYCCSMLEPITEEDSDDLSTSNDNSRSDELLGVKEIEYDLEYEERKRGLFTDSMGITQKTIYSTSKDSGPNLIGSVLSPSLNKPDTEAVHSQQTISHMSGPLPDLEKQGTRLTSVNSQQAAGTDYETISGSGASRLTCSEALTDDSSPVSSRSARQDCGVETNVFQTDDYYKYIRNHGSCVDRIFPTLVSLSKSKNLFDDDESNKVNLPVTGENRNVIRQGGISLLSGGEHGNVPLNFVQTQSSNRNEGNLFENNSLPLNITGQINHDEDIKPVTGQGLTSGVRPIPIRTQRPVSDEFVYSKKRKSEDEEDAFFRDRIVSEGGAVSSRDNQINTDISGALLTDESNVYLDNNRLNSHLNTRINAYLNTSDISSTYLGNHVDISEHGSNIHIVPVGIRVQEETTDSKCDDIDGDNRGYTVVKSVNKLSVRSSASSQDSKKDLTDTKLLLVNSQKSKKIKSRTGVHKMDSREYSVSDSVDRFSDRNSISGRRETDDETEWEEEVTETFVVPGSQERTILRTLQSVKDMLDQRTAVRRSELIPRDDDEDDTGGSSCVTTMIGVDGHDEGGFTGNSDITSGYRDQFNSVARMDRDLKEKLGFELNLEEYKTDDYNTESGWPIVRYIEKERFYIEDNGLESNDYSRDSNNDGRVAYFRDRESNSDSRDVYYRESNNDSRDVYYRESNNDSRDVYYRDRESNSDSRDAYERYLDSKTVSSDVYERYADSNTDSIDVYERYVDSNTISRDTYGRYVGSSSDSKDVYERYVGSNTDSVDAYEVDVDSNHVRDVYNREHVSSVDEEDLYSSDSIAYGQYIDRREMEVLNEEDEEKEQAYVLDRDGYYDGGGWNEEAIQDEEKVGGVDIDEDEFEDKQSVNDYVENQIQATHVTTYGVGVEQFVSVDSKQTTYPRPIPQPPADDIPVLIAHRPDFKRSASEEQFAKLEQGNIMSPTICVPPSPVLKAKTSSNSHRTTSPRVEISDSVMVQENVHATGSFTTFFSDGLHEDSDKIRQEKSLDRFTSFTDGIVVKKDHLNVEYEDFVREMSYKNDIPITPGLGSAILSGNLATPHKNQDVFLFPNEEATDINVSSNDNGESNDAEVKGGKRSEVDNSEPSTPVKKPRFVRTSTAQDEDDLLAFKPGLRRSSSYSVYDGSSSILNRSFEEASSSNFTFDRLDSEPGMLRRNKSRDDLSRSLSREVLHPESPTVEFRSFPESPRKHYTPKFFGEPVLDVVLESSANEQLRTGSSSTDSAPVTPLNSQVKETELVTPPVVWTRVITDSNFVEEKRSPPTKTASKVSTKLLDTVDGGETSTSVPKKVIQENVNDLKFADAEDSLKNSVTTAFNPTNILPTIIPTKSYPTLEHSSTFPQRTQLISPNIDSTLERIRSKFNPNNIDSTLERVSALIQRTTLIPTKSNPTPVSIFTVLPKPTLIPTKAESTFARSSTFQPRSSLISTHFDPKLEHASSILQRSTLIPTKADSTSEHATSILQRSTLIPTKADSTSEHATSILQRSTLIPTKADSTSEHATSILQKSTLIPTKADSTSEHVSSILQRSTPIPTKADSTIEHASSILQRTTLIPTKADSTNEHATSILQRSTPIPTKADSTIEHASSILQRQTHVQTKADSTNEHATSILQRSTPILTKADSTIEHASSILQRQTHVQTKADSNNQHTTSILQRSTPIPTQFDSTLESSSTFLPRASLAPTSFNSTIEQTSSIVQRPTLTPTSVDPTSEQTSSIVQRPTLTPTKVDPTSEHTSSILQRPTLSSTSVESTLEHSSSIPQRPLLAPKPRTVMRPFSSLKAPPSTTAVKTTSTSILHRTEPVADAAISILSPPKSSPLSNLQEVLPSIQVKDSQASDQPKLSSSHLQQTVPAPVHDGHQIATKPPLAPKPRKSSLSSGRTESVQSVIPDRLSPTFSVDRLEKKIELFSPEIRRSVHLTNMEEVEDKNSQEGIDFMDGRIQIDVDKEEIESEEEDSEDEEEESSEDQDDDDDEEKASEDKMNEIDINHVTHELPVHSQTHAASDQLSQMSHSVNTSDDVFLQQPAAMSVLTSSDFEIMQKSHAPSLISVSNIATPSTVSSPVTPETLQTVVSSPKKPRTLKEIKKRYKQPYKSVLTQEPTSPTSPKIAPFVLPENLLTPSRLKIIQSRNRFLSEQNLLSDSFAGEFAAHKETMSQVTSSSKDRRYTPKMSKNPNYRSQEQLEKLMYMINLKHGRSENSLHKTHADCLHDDCILSEKGRREIIDKTLSIDNLHADLYRHLQRYHSETDTDGGLQSDVYFPETNSDMFDLTFPFQSEGRRYLDRPASMSELRHASDYTTISGAGSGYFDAAESKGKGRFSQRQYKKSKSLCTLETNLDDVNFATSPTNDGLQRVPSAHELRISKSLQKLNVPNWYKQSSLSKSGSCLLKYGSSSSMTSWALSPSLLSSPCTTPSTSSNVVIKSRVQLPTSSRNLRSPRFASKSAPSTPSFLNQSEEDASSTSPVKLPSEKMRTMDKPKALMPIPIVPFDKIRAMFEKSQEHIKTQKPRREESPVSTTPLSSSIAKGQTQRSTMISPPKNLAINGDDAHDTEDFIPKVIVSPTDPNVKSILKRSIQEKRYSDIQETQEADDESAIVKPIPTKPSESAPTTTLSQVPTLIRAPQTSKQQPIPTVISAPQTSKQQTIPTLISAAQTSKQQPIPTLISAPQTSKQQPIPTLISAPQTSKQQPIPTLISAHQSQKQQPAPTLISPPEPSKQPPKITLISAPQRPNQQPISEPQPLQQQPAIKPQIKTKPLPPERSTSGLKSLPTPKGEMKPSNILKEDQIPPKLQKEEERQTPPIAKSKGFAFFKSLRSSSSSSTEEVKDKGRKSPREKDNKSPTTPSLSADSSYDSPDTFPASPASRLSPVGTKSPPTISITPDASRSKGHPYVNVAVDRPGDSTSILEPSPIVKPSWQRSSDAPVIERTTHDIQEVSYSEPLRQNVPRNTKSPDSVEETNIDDSYEEETVPPKLELVIHETQPEKRRWFPKSKSTRTLKSPEEPIKPIPKSKESQSTFEIQQLSDEPRRLRSPLESASFSDTSEGSKHGYSQREHDRSRASEHFSDVSRSTARESDLDRSRDSYSSRSGDRSRELERDFTRDSKIPGRQVSVESDHSFDRAANPDTSLGSGRGSVRGGRDSNRHISDEHNLSIDSVHSGRYSDRSAPIDDPDRSIGSFQSGRYSDRSAPVNDPDRSIGSFQSGRDSDRNARLDDRNRSSGSTRNARYSYSEDDKSDGSKDHDYNPKFDRRDARDYDRRDAEYDRHRDLDSKDRDYDRDRDYYRRDLDYDSREQDSNARDRFGRDYDSRNPPARRDRDRGSREGSTYSKESESDNDSRRGDLYTNSLPRGGTLNSDVSRNSLPRGGTLNSDVFRNSLPRSGTLNSDVSRNSLTRGGTLNSDVSRDSRIGRHSDSYEDTTASRTSLSSGRSWQPKPRGSRGLDSSPPKRVIPAVEDSSKTDKSSLDSNGTPANSSPYRYRVAGSAFSASIPNAVAGLSTPPSGRHDISTSSKSDAGSSKSLKETTV